MLSVNQQTLLIQSEIDLVMRNFCFVGAIQ